VAWGIACVKNNFLRTEGFRLSAIYTAVFAVCVAVMAMMMVLTTQEALRNQMLRFAGADIAAIRHGYASEGIPEAREVIHQLMAAPNARSYFLLQKAGKPIDGNMLALPQKAGSVELPPSPATGGHAVLGVGDFLAPDLYIFAGSDVRRLAAARARILSMVGWLAAAGLLMAIAGGALVSRAFLRRTDAMAKACRAIMDGDMSLRIPVRGTGDELDRLADAINEMLARIGALMGNLSQVSNDIAHDLRTPVTHLRHRLERARAESRSMEDHGAALDAAILKADEILGLFTALLRIAQIEGGDRRAAFAPVDLSALLRQVRDMFEPVAEEASCRLEFLAPEGLMLRGDRALLVQLFSNLLENAIVHTPPGTCIALELHDEDGCLRALVADSGPGVPIAERDRIFRRLYRLEASRSKPGYGLGLSLVAAIAELHGASLSVKDRNPGLGIEITFAAMKPED
jgi:signal transduction histidine kinase